MQVLEHEGRVILSQVGLLLFSLLLLLLVSLLGVLFRVWVDSSSWEVVLASQFAARSNKILLVDHIRVKAYVVVILVLFDPLLVHRVHLVLVIAKDERCLILEEGVLNAIIIGVDHGHLEASLAFFLVWFLTELCSAFGRFSSHLQVRERVIVDRQRWLIVVRRRGSFSILDLVFLLVFHLDGCGAQDALDTLIYLVGLRLEHHDVIRDVLFGRTKSGQLIRIFVFADLRMRGQQLLERVHGLVHASLEELTLVEQRSVGYVLENVRVVNHLLKGIHAKDAFNLSVESFVIDEAWIDDDLVHEALHDLLVFLFVEVLVIRLRLLGWRHIV